MYILLSSVVCSYALVLVEIKNEGDDAFKPEVYGDVIIVERRISESTSSTVLKDYQGLFQFLITFWYEVIFSFMFLFMTE